MRIITICRNKEEPDEDHHKMQTDILDPLL